MIAIILMSMPRRYFLQWAFPPFLGLLPGLIVYPANSQEKPMGRTVLYASVGPELTRYEVATQTGLLSRRDSITLPANVQEAWTHPSKKFIYVAWSNGGASYQGGQGAGSAGTRHGVTAFRIDPKTGALTQHGQPAALPSRPVYITTDIDGTHVITAHNSPSALTVYRILPDGTVGDEIKQTRKLDFGIYGHQVRMDPSNRAVILVTRGNAPTAEKAEDPGAIKIFAYKDGVLSNLESVAPNGGYGFQVRHLEFHPSGKWDYVTLERQNKIQMYRRSADGKLSEAAVFSKDTVANPAAGKGGQAASSIHAHPNGSYIYVANRSGETVEFQGKRVFAGGENSIAVFSIHRETGEPTLIQSVDTHGFQPRTFAMDASGKVLVVGNQSPALIRDGSTVKPVPANLAVFHIKGDGRLEFAEKYDLETTSSTPLFWVGMVSLPQVN
jgi:6-phosphogluconolactonase (cycloisomerase 2 family)